jgi:hypothetical protein
MTQFLLLLTELCEDAFQLLALPIGFRRGGAKGTFLPRPGFKLGYGIGMHGVNKSKERMHKKDFDK